MKIIKPNWIHGSETQISSLDIHPDGSKLVTGGQLSKTYCILIWNLLPICDEDKELDQLTPKLLCRIESQACIHCVRFSLKGHVLAVAQGETVTIYHKTGTSIVQQPTTASAFSANFPEKWSTRVVLREHKAEVLDLSWAPADRYLASCSVDNKIIVYDGKTLTSVIAILEGHTGIVKGIAWDPTCVYLASQCADCTLKIWSTQSWKVEKTIDEPFIECADFTQYLRLSWSPDGQTLTTAHAKNGCFPVAKTIARKTWQFKEDLAGHKKEVTCVRYFPRILEINGKKRCLVAVGSRDRSVSLWLTSPRQAVCGLRDLFSNSIVDMTWALIPTRKNICLALCSLDGTCCVILFEQNELGKPFEYEQMCEFWSQYYKIPRDRFDLSSGMKKPQIIQSSPIKIQHQTTVNNIVQNPRPPSPKPKLTNGHVSSSNDIQSQPAQSTSDKAVTVQPTQIAPSPSVQQQTSVLTSASTTTVITSVHIDQSERRLTDGRRCIKPFCVATATTNGDEDMITSSDTQVVSSMASVSSSKPLVLTNDPFKTPHQQQEKRIPPIPCDKRLTVSTITTTAPPHPSLLSSPLSRSTSASVIFPTLKLQSNFLKLSNKNEYRIENYLQKKSIHLLSCYSHDNHLLLWKSSFQSPILTLSICSQILCLSTYEESQHLYDLYVLTTQSGLRLYSNICLIQPLAGLYCSESKNDQTCTISVVYSNGTLTVFELLLTTTEMKCVMNDSYIGHLVTANSSIVDIFTFKHLTNKTICIITSNGHLYAYDSNLKHWTCLYKRQDILFDSSLPKSIGPLANLSFTQQSTTSTTTTNQDEELLYLSNYRELLCSNYLETMINRSNVLKSSQEYSFWLTSHIRYLASSNLTDRLRKIQDSLEILFKFYNSATTTTKLKDENKKIIEECVQILETYPDTINLATHYKAQL
ncbi:unnamed protein product [Didymodactylos carnosus]|uniref:Protein HIRA n=1 Tax=Didymodactylos carnosus TaxID=1234261 RepID=A0A8S2IPR6_9BILA|nr:unnamed protein product [Didymodactylos carnosus]CAF3757867.1 unnamed protein product [Didymodactylos carnosus]